MPFSLMLALSISHRLQLFDRHDPGSMSSGRRQLKPLSHIIRAGGVLIAEVGLHDQNSIL